MKKIIKLINIIIILIFAFSNITFATNEPVIYSEAAVLIEASTGTILYGKNENEKLYPASTTKILTAIIALEKCDLNEKAVASKEAIYSIPPNYAIADIHVGEEFTIEQLLNVMLLHSANEAANVIAEHISGTTEEFAKLMNEKAKELGCKNSNFVNANGIQNDNHYSTAYDMALIAKYCIKNEEFRNIIVNPKCELPETSLYTGQRVFRNNNSLLDSKDKYYYEYCIGGKTGYTKEAENCLVSISNKDGMELITVVLKGMNTENGESARNVDTINLFNYGYENYNITTIKKKGEKLTSIDIKKSEGQTKKIDVTLEDDISIINVPKDQTNNIKPKIELNVDKAPIQQGEVIGTATYSINGEDYTSNLLAAETVGEDNIDKKSSIYNIFKTIIVLFIVVIILNFIKRVNILNTKRSRKYTKRRKNSRYKKGRHSL